MFMKTMAVGPFEPAEFCVTGGATVALPLLQRWTDGDRAGAAGEFHVARFAACIRGVRIAIVCSSGRWQAPEVYRSKFVAEARRAM